VSTEFKSSMQAIETAIAALPETQRKSPSFVLQVINGLLDTANSEYAASIADGKIAQVIEYQDSRGFVAYASELLKGISPQLSKDNPDIAKAVEVDLANLAKTWGTSPLPPAAPVNSSDQVSKLVKTIEQNTQKAVKSS
jgi:hypothetical protein